MSREWCQTGAAKISKSQKQGRECVKKTAVDVGDNLIEDDGIGDNVIFLVRMPNAECCFLHFVSSMSLAWLL